MKNLMFILLAVALVGLVIGGVVWSKNQKKKKDANLAYSTKAANETAALGNSRAAAVTGQAVPGGIYTTVGEQDQSPGLIGSVFGQSANVVNTVVGGSMDIARPALTNTGSIVNSATSMPASVLKGAARFIANPGVVLFPKITARRRR